MPPAILTPVALNESRLLYKAPYTNVPPYALAGAAGPLPTLTIYAPSGASYSPTIVADGPTNTWRTDTPFTFDEAGVWHLEWVGLDVAAGMLYDMEMDEIVCSSQDSVRIEDAADSAAAATTAVNNNVGPLSLITPGTVGYKVQNFDDAWAVWESITAPIEVYGPLDAIQAIVASGTFGNAAIKTLLDAVDTNVSTVQSASNNIYNIVNDGVFGNEQIKFQTDNINAQMNELLNRLTTLRADNLDDIPTILSAVGAAEANTAELLLRLTLARAALLDTLRPDNIRMEVTQGDANLPTKVQYKLKASTDPDFTTPFATIVMEFKDPSATRPRQLYVKEGLS